MHPSFKKVLSILLTALMLLAGCAAIAEEAAPAPTPTSTPEAAEAKTPEKAQWTVLVYLCGTDLESEGSMATYNLEEIAKTTANESVNVVIQTGGAKEWHAQETLGLDIAADKLQRYTYGVDGFSLADEQPLANMANASTLTDFIQWGAQAYPAEKYALVLWDHGGGSAGGLIQDELHDYAIMPLEQMEIALDASKVSIEALVLDTCLMATLETAQAAQNSAKYLIASQETVPGAGSAYQSWLQYLYNNPACNGARLGRVICDATQQKYAELGMTSSVRQLTFSVIDLSRIGAVSAAFDKMFLEISALLSDPENFSAFGFFTQRMQHYYYDQMVDLADMARRAQNLVVTNDTANAVIEAVDAAVVCNLKGDLRSYSYGLSFYYNTTATSEQLDHYARSCKSAPYLAFLDAASLGWTAPAWVYEKTARVPEITRADYLVETAVNLTPEGLPLLSVTNAKLAVTMVDATLYQYEKSSDSWLKLGTSEKVEGDFDTGKFTMSFPETWQTVNGNLCSIRIVEETDTHALYSIPFQIVYRETELYDYQFRLAYIYDVPLDTETEVSAQPAEEGGEAADPYAGYYEFYGVWDMDNANSAALPSRSSSELSYYYGYSIRTSLQRVALPSFEPMGCTYSKQFMLDADLTIGEAPLPSGKYAIAFNVTDALGKTYTTEPVYVAWNGKTAVYSGVETLVETEAEAEAETGTEAEAEASTEAEPETETETETEAEPGTETEAETSAAA